METAMELSEQKEDGAAATKNIGNSIKPIKIESEDFFIVPHDGDEMSEEICPNDECEEFLDEVYEDFCQSAQKAAAEALSTVIQIDDGESDSELSCVVMNDHNYMSQKTQSLEDRTSARQQTLKDDILNYIVRHKAAAREADDNEGNVYVAAEIRNFVECIFESINSFVPKDVIKRESDSDAYLDEEEAERRKENQQKRDQFVENIMNVLQADEDADEDDYADSEVSMDDDARMAYAEVLLDSIMGDDKSAEIENIKKEKSSGDLTNGNEVKSELSLEKMLKEIPTPNEDVVTDAVCTKEGEDDSKRDQKDDQETVECSKRDENAVEDNVPVSMTVEVETTSSSKKIEINEIRPLEPENVEEETAEPATNSEEPKSTTSVEDKDKDENQKTKELKGDNENFGNSTTIQLSPTSIPTQQLLENMKTFAVEMQEDCSKFLDTPATPDLDDRLNAYINEQIKKLIALTDLTATRTDFATQTDPLDENSTLRNIKEALLEFTDTQSDTDYSIDTEMLIVKQSKRAKKRKVRSRDASDCNENATQMDTTDMEDEYGDAYMTLVDRSPKDRRVNEASTANKKVDVNDEDSEVERLLNINDITKHKIVKAPTKKDTPQLDKKKSLQQKDAKDDDDEKDDEQHDDLGLEDDHYHHDEAANESSNNETDKEVLTEQQYLAKYNDDLKKQLLDSSSSDSEHTTEEDTELLNPLSGVDDEEDDSNNAQLVDKFLKTFNVDDSENEEDAELEVEVEAEAEVLVASKADDDVANDEKEKNGEHVENLSKDVEATSAQNQDENETNEKAPKSPAVEDKDDEVSMLLDIQSVHSSRSKPKTLQTMLADADKRKIKVKSNADDLISLSSDSTEGSDVEHVDTKARILKPMLRQDQLASETRIAQKSENERIKRLEKKQAVLAKALKEHAKKIDPNDLILDYNEDTQWFIKVHPGIVKHLKPHQVDGVKFMYDSVYGGVESLKKHAGSGCILAHCMGLGKTLQLIALLHTVISYKELRTTKILVLCPKSTVMNWADEVVRWLGPLNCKNMKVFTFQDTSDINEKLNILKEWSLSSSTKSGCLLLGYEAFRTLVFYHSYKNRGNTSLTKLENIRDTVDKYLLRRGADLVVCDEGHIIKNSKSAISLAVAKIKTPKRIILTGTPIQNNLKEYYSMVNFIKPLFLGTEKEFANLYANPIKNGQHKDSSKRDIKVMKQRSFVLHKKLCKFVQRKEAELLKTFLPEKFEYVLFVPMTEVQKNLYEHILEAIKKREDNRGRGLITDYTCLRKIWTHPKVLEDAWKNANNLKYKKDMRRNQQMPHSDDDQPDDIYDSQTGIMSVTNDWWRHLVTDNDLENITPSNKLRAMFEILRMCEEKGEKCLIFSAFVAVLNVVEYFFKKITEGDPQVLQELNPSQKNTGKWLPGMDYYRLDGKTAKSIRHEMIKSFNSPTNPRARVFLISAKAGGQGINLTGANRVIILDTSWNPSNDQQNIFRVFRLGQKKKCYIYRLLAMGTMEEKVYSRSVTKQAMSFRVVDEQQIDRHFSMAELSELYTLTMPDYSDRPMPTFPQDSVLASLLVNHPNLAYKYHEHDSLLENKVEQELSEQEKADAWAAYEGDLQAQNFAELKDFTNLNGVQPNMPHMGLPNYLGGLAGFDMQSHMNYGQLGQTPSGGSLSLMQSILSQYTNQQYLDMLNMYSKLPFSRMASSPATKTGSYPTLSYGGKGNAASTNPILQNPLSALGDMSMYGLPATSSSSVAAAVAAHQQQQHHSSMYMPTTSTGNSNLFLPPYDPYKTPFDSSAFGGLYNYPTAMAAAAAAATSSTSQRGSPGSSKGSCGTPPVAHGQPPKASPQQQLSPHQQYMGANVAPTAMVTTSSPSNSTLYQNVKQQQQLIQQQKQQLLIQQQKQQQQQQLQHQQQKQQMQQQQPLPKLQPISKQPQPQNMSKQSQQQQSPPPDIALAQSKTPAVPTKATPTFKKQTTGLAEAAANAALASLGKRGSPIISNNTPSPKPSTPQAANKHANGSIHVDLTTTTMATPNAKQVPHVEAMKRLRKKTATPQGKNPISTTNHNNDIPIIDLIETSPPHPSLPAKSTTTPRMTTKPPTTTTAPSTYLTKRNSEMEIIPTTGTTGVLPISKQLNDIAPSISVTAVRNSQAKGNTNNNNSNSSNNNNNNKTTTNVGNFYAKKYAKATAIPYHNNNNNSLKKTTTSSTVIPSTTSITTTTTTGNKQQIKPTLPPLTSGLTIKSVQSLSTAQNQTTATTTTPAASAVTTARAPALQRKQQSLLINSNVPQTKSPSVPEMSRKSLPQQQSKVLVRTPTPTRNQTSPRTATPTRTSTPTTMTKNIMHTKTPQSLRIESLGVPKTPLAISAAVNTKTIQNFRTGNLNIPATTAAPGPGPVPVSLSLGKTMYTDKSQRTNSPTYITPNIRLTTTKGPTKSLALGRKRSTPESFTVDPSKQGPDHPKKIKRDE